MSQLLRAGSGCSFELRTGFTLNRIFVSRSTYLPLRQLSHPNGHSLFHSQFNLWACYRRRRSQDKLSVSDAEKYSQSMKVGGIRSHPEKTAQKPPPNKFTPPDAEKLHPLSREQSQILKLVQQGHNVFFTGPAGSGKSLILKHIKRHFELKDIKYAVTATTGVAAVIVEGTTIHSWAGVGKGDNLFFKVIEYYGQERRGSAYSGRKRWRKKKADRFDAWEDVQVLMIDEVSMLSPDLFDKLNALGKAIRQNDKFFGGLQLIVCGDFYQLPPVHLEHEKTCTNCGAPIPPREARSYLPATSKQVSDQMLRHLQGVGISSERWMKCQERDVVTWMTCGHLYNETIRYAFQTSSWAEANFRTVVLKEIFRQTEKHWVGMLERIKVGDIDEETAVSLDRLRRPLATLPSGIVPTKLETHRKTVLSINQREFKKLPGNEIKYSAADSGAVYGSTNGVGVYSKMRSLKPHELDDEPFYKYLQAPKEVFLKLGAQVMLLSNLNPLQGLVNGARGIVEGFETFTFDSLIKQLPSKGGNKEALENFFLENATDGVVSVPLVTFCSDIKKRIVPVLWDQRVQRSDEEVVVVQRFQIPLALAWATTIHKAQGMTLDYAVVAVEDSFVPGQGYVALSRVRSSENLHISTRSGYIVWDEVFWADGAVKKFHQVLAEKEIEPPQEIVADERVVEEPCEQIVAQERVVEGPYEQVVEGPYEQVVEGPYEQVVEGPYEQVVEQERVAEEPHKQMDAQEWVIKEPYKQVVEKPDKQVAEERYKRVAAQECVGEEPYKQVFRDILQERMVEEPPEEVYVWDEEDHTDVDWEVYKKYQ